MHLESILKPEQKMKNSILSYLCAESNLHSFTFSTKMYGHAIIPLSGQPAQCHAVQVVPFLVFGNLKISHMTSYYQ